MNFHHLAAVELTRFMAVRFTFITHNSFNMKQLLTIFLFSLLVSATAFGQASNEVIFSFDHKVGSESLILNETVFTIWNGKKAVLTRAEFYISEAGIQHPDGSKMPLTDQFLLVNANNPTAEFGLGIWPVEAAHGATLHIGVPSALNHLDPAIYPADHPLAPKNPAMHWGWSAGYRFLVAEGKIDNNGDGVPETVFQWHNLGDALYKTVELTGLEEAKNGVLHLHFLIDYVQLFKSLAMTGNLTQHGSASANVKMMSNAATENFLTMPMIISAHEVQANSQKVVATPNPFSTETRLNFDLPAADGLTMVVTNLLGQAVRSVAGLPAAGSLVFEKGELPGGIYQSAFYENGRLLARKRLVIGE